MTSPNDSPAASPSSDAISRRRLLVAAGAGAGWLATLAGGLNLGRRARTWPTPAEAGPPSDEGPAGPSAAKPRVLTPDEWRTLDAALDVLLPSGPGSPGARDCNGIGYLDAALADPDTDPADVTLVRSGATWLDEAIRNVTPRGAGGATQGTRFSEASAEAKDAAMHAIARRERGTDWLNVVLAFGLESMLGDPVHGGNPNEIGWRWIGHRSGEPRPQGTPVALPKAVEPGSGTRR